MSHNTVKFVPFTSSVDASFWLKVSDYKLHKMRLQEGPVSILASYTINPNMHISSSANTASSSSPTITPIAPPRMRLDQNSLFSNEAGSNLNENANDNTNHDTNMEIMEKWKNKIMVENEAIHCPTTFYVYNTAEAFKRVDKNQILNKYTQTILQAISSSHSESSSSLSSKSLEALYSMLIISFLDLKKHKVVYWCAFPALATSPGNSIIYQPIPSSLYTSITTTSTPTPSNHSNKKSPLLSHVIPPDRHDELAVAFHSMRLDMLQRQLPLCPFFQVHHLFTKDQLEVDIKIQCTPLNDTTDAATDATSSNDNHDTLCFAFLDPSNDTNHPGWPLRNLIAYLSLSPRFQHLNLVHQTVFIISFRPSILRRIDHINPTNTHYNAPSTIHTSLLFSIQIPSPSQYHWNPNDSHKQNNPYFQSLGWEKNTKQKLAPRLLSLSSLLSPSHLASTAVNLNLSLMKWRQIPNLNTNLLSQTKCLLLGAGTLGCNVARILLGWGITSITFVDNGFVTYSNPARQSLFTIADVHKEKSKVAANCLKTIVPGVQSHGVTLNIPMPGHDSTIATKTHSSDHSKKDYQILKELIMDCDVVFLLTDTRESRWLPTLMAKQMGKILINAALGLDTYLVMRHGMRSPTTTSTTGSTTTTTTTTDPPSKRSTCTVGKILGCYFCNDVVAPENSTRERTLDQQCTVTRPGLAPIAGSLAVEMMVALLHYENSSSSNKGEDHQKGDYSSLGLIPHQIRGSISSHTMMTPNVPAFQHCTACSDAVLQCYEDMGEDFIDKICCSAVDSIEFLETLTGLKDFRTKAEMVEVDWDDDDDDF